MATKILDTDFRSAHAPGPGCKRELTRLVNDEDGRSANKMFLLRPPNLSPARCVETGVDFGPTEEQYSGRRTIQCKPLHFSERLTCTRP